MRLRVLRPATIIAAAILALPASAGSQSRSVPPLPLPLANNAVAAVEGETGPVLFSFLGLGGSKRFDAITNRAFRWAAGDSAWTELSPVPGPPRIAATAQAVGGRVYVFGGYTVAEDGSERTIETVAILDVATSRWTEGNPIPVPVDDAVSGVSADSLIYLVSGWRDADNVSNVQVYDPASDSWAQATPIRGGSVFGHSGAVSGRTIVYVDGARRSEGSPRYSL